MLPLTLSLCDDQSTHIWRGQEKIRLPVAMLNVVQSVFRHALVVSRTTDRVHWVAPLRSGVAGVAHLRGCFPIYEQQKKNIFSTCVT